MAKVQIDAAKLGAYLRQANGPVMRKMMTAGEVVKRETINSMNSEFPRKFFGTSLVKRLEMHADGPHVFVGASRTKTKPHPISGNPLLVFFWPKAGKTMYLRNVNHPGSDFTAYITKKLKQGLNAAKGKI